MLGQTLHVVSIMGPTSYVKVRYVRIFPFKLTQQHEAKIIGLFESLSRPFLSQFVILQRKEIYIYIYIYNSKIQNERGKKEVIEAKLHQVFEDFRYSLIHFIVWNEFNKLEIAFNIILFKILKDLILECIVKNGKY